MKEILFRGKDKDDGNWYEGYYLQLHDTTYCCMPSDNVKANRLNEENEHHYIVFERMTDWGLPNKHLRAEVLQETVCQYIGIEDKNKKSIFERDIIKRKIFGDFIIGEVVWLDTGFCGFYLKCGNRYYPIGKSEHSGRSECDEIIGNIFDNPELLKGDRAE